MGAFTFGGGYGMLPLIEDAVISHSWMTAEELINFLAVSESTPGSMSVNISTFVGYQVAGLPGAFTATLGVILPLFVIIFLIAKFYRQFRTNHVIRGMMVGLEPAVIGMIGAGAISVMSTIFFQNGALIDTTTLLIKAGLTVLLLILSIKNVHPILVIVISAVIGIALGNIL